MAVNHDLLLWACAVAIEREHGPAAFLHTAMKIEELDSAGQNEGAVVWRAILKRLKEQEVGKAPPQ